MDKKVNVQLTQNEATFLSELLNVLRFDQEKDWNNKVYYVSDCSHLESIEWTWQQKKAWETVTLKLSVSMDKAKIYRRRGF